MDIMLQFNISHRIFKVKDQEDGNFGKEYLYSTAIIDGCEIDVVIYETRRYLIALEYFKSWFVIDVLAITPLIIESILTLSQSTNEGTGSSIRLAKTLRIPRLLCLIKVGKVFG